jgi:hypothetical protein
MGANVGSATITRVADINEDAFEQFLEMPHRRVAPRLRAAIRARDPAEHRRHTFAV